MMQKELVAIGTQTGRPGGRRIGIFEVKILCEQHLLTSLTEKARVCV